MDILNAVGAIASIGAAVVAVWQASRAKRYRDELQSLSVKQLLIELLGKGERARLECRKLGSTSSQSVRGVDRQAIMAELHSFVDKLSDNQHLWGRGPVVDRISKTRNLLVQYSQLSDESKRRTCADAIDENICWLIPELKRRLDEKL